MLLSSVSLVSYGQDWATQGNNLYSTNEGSVVVGTQDQQLVSQNLSSTTHVSNVTVIAQPFTLSQSQTINQVDFYLTGVALPGPSLTVSIGQNASCTGSLWETTTSSSSAKVSLSWAGTQLAAGTYYLRVVSSSPLSYVIADAQSKTPASVLNGCGGKIEPQYPGEIKHSIWAVGDIAPRSNPMGTLHVQGDVYSSTGYKFPDGTQQQTAASQLWNVNGTSASYPYKVGIGIATPNVNLSVDGIIRAADDENETEYTEIGHGGAHGYINTHGDGTLAFRHHGVTKMQLTDQAKLQVFGTVQSTEGGFQFPDGTIQTTAAGQNTTAPQVYIIPNTINVLPVADYYRNESSTMNGITGIRGGYDGKVVYIELIPSASGTPPNSGLYFESTSAEAENRIMAPRDYGFSAMSLHEGQWVSLVYDGTMERWRIIDLFDDGYLLNISNGSNVGGAYLTYVGDDGENKATNIYYKETLSQTLIGVDNIPEFPIPQDFKLGAESAYISNLQTEQIQLKSSEDRILDFYRSNADPGANSNLDHVVYRWLVGADGALVLSKKGSDGNGNTFFEPEFKIDQNIFGVNGQLGALQEFTLKGNFEALWADYVFDDSYELMPLYAIEEYIKANHHLPEMPTAADVQADGIKFSEVSILYLKKIEELTLHMIAMQKEIDSLKTQLQQK